MNAAGFPTGLAVAVSALSRDPASLPSNLALLSSQFHDFSRESTASTGVDDVSASWLSGAVPSRMIPSNNTRQGSTRKGTLKPAGFLFLGFAFRPPAGVVVPQ